MFEFWSENFVEINVNPIYERDMCSWDKFLSRFVLPDLDKYLCTDQKDP